jgi:small-conductance mechanosensitive channel
MTERRVVFSFGVLYTTPIAALEQIPSLVKEIIQGIDQTRFDRAHFATFGDSALNFEVVYYVLDPDYNLSILLPSRILFFAQAFSRSPRELFDRSLSGGVDCGHLGAA